MMEWCAAHWGFEVAPKTRGDGGIGLSTDVGGLLLSRRRPHWLRAISFRLLGSCIRAGLRRRRRRCPTFRGPHRRYAELRFENKKVTSWPCANHEFGGIRTI